jgi:hypothetical protein
MQDASKGEYAYLICELDDVPTEATLDKIRALEGVIRVRLLK